MLLPSDSYALSTVALGLIGILLGYTYWYWCVRHDGCLPLTEIPSMQSIQSDRQNKDYEIPPSTSDKLQGLGRPELR